MGVLAACCVTLMCCVLLGCAAPGSAPATKENEPDANRGTVLLPPTGADIRGTITDVRRMPRKPGVSGEERGPDTPVSSDDARRGGPGRTTGDRSVAGQIGVVLVEENPEEEAGSQKDSVTVTRTTRLVGRGAQDPVSIGFDDLEVGQRAEAWYTGPIAESYPRQATARVILVHQPAE